jgi:hypothetical protein
MLVMNLFGEFDHKEASEQAEPEYPDEVLESAWNPVLLEVHSSIISEKKTDESAPQSKKD